MPHALAASKEFRNSYAEEKRPEDRKMEGLKVPSAGQSGLGRLSEGCEPALKGWTVLRRRSEESMNPNI